MQVILVMLRSGGEKRSFSIARDVTVVGRREDSDFRIPLGEISRKHCRLIKDGGSLRIEDLGSSNGTTVNGVRIQEAELAPGDTVQLGSVSFIVQIDGVPSDDELMSIAAVAPGDQANPGPAAAVDEDDLLAKPNTAHAESLGEGVGAVEGVAAEYDPMAVLADPEASSIGSVITDVPLDDDLLIDFDQHEQPGQQA